MSTAAATRYITLSSFCMSISALFLRIFRAYQQPREPPTGIPIGRLNLMGRFAMLFSILIISHALVSFAVDTSFLALAMRENELWREHLLSSILISSITGQCIWTVSFSLPGSWAFNHYVLPGVSLSCILVFLLGQTTPTEQKGFVTAASALSAFRGWLAIEWWMYAWSLRSYDKLLPFCVVESAAAVLTVLSAIAAGLGVVELSSTSGNALMSFTYSLHDLVVEFCFRGIRGVRKTILPFSAELVRLGSSGGTQAV